VPSQDYANLRVVEFNIERGTQWCAAAHLIRTTDSTKDADVIFINEADWGMSRSGNVHVARLLAYELGMNYVWATEFIELTPGNKEETLRARDAKDCPLKWRGVTWRSRGKLDALGLHGNAILSRYKLQAPSIVRLPGIDILYNSKSGQAITANGFEKRLGGRMVLYASIEVGDAARTIPIQLGCFHLQMLWDRGAEWEAYGKPSVDLIKTHNSDRDPSGNQLFVMGGDGWYPPWCMEHLPGFKTHKFVSGDWICQRGFLSAGPVTRTPARGASDHDLFGIDLKF